MQIYLIHPGSLIFRYLLKNPAFDRLDFFKIKAFYIKVSNPQCTWQEIKLSTMRTKPQDDIAENEQEMAAAVINAAKKTLITQVVKRNVIENIVPIVISLKHMVGIWWFLKYNLMG